MNKFTLESYINQSRICRWANKIFKFTLDFNGYDPFLINKRAIRQKQLVGKAEFERGYGRFRKCLLVLYSYLTIKFYIVGVFRWILETKKEKNNPIDDDHVQQGKKLIEISNDVINFVGDPLSELADLGFMLYLCSSSLAISSFCLWPRYFHMNPMNASGIRFMINPSVEIERIDRLIENKLNTALNLLEFFKLYLPKYNKESYYDTSSFERRLLLQSSLKRTECQYELIKKYQKNIHLFRPYTVTTDWYKKFSFFYIQMVLVHFGPNVPIATFIPIVIFVLSLTSKCIRMEIEDCHVSDVLNKRELFMVGEISLMASTIYLCYNTFSTILCMQGRYQLEMTNQMKKDLERCLYWLRYLNRYNRYYDRKKQDLLIDSILIETLIRSLIYESDTKQSINFLSKLMSLSLFNCAFGTFLFFFLISIENSLTVDVKTRTFLYLWFFSNFLNGLCAYLLTQFVAMKKVGWSILAELARRKEILSIRHDDLMSILWRKQVNNRRSIEDHYPVKPFNMHLNFSRTLEINVFVITIVTFLQATK